MEKELNVRMVDNTCVATYSEGGQEVATLEWDKIPDKVKTLFDVVTSLLEKERGKDAPPSTPEGSDVKMF